MSDDNVIVAPNVRDLDDLRQSLTTWISEKVLDGAEARLENFSYPFGAGRSHETILFDAVWTEQGKERTQGMVVRIKPTDHLYYPHDLFDEQYQLMRVLHEQGHVRIAKPLAFEASSDLVGAPFFVMEKKYGRVASTSSPPYAQGGWVAEATPEQRRIMSTNAVRQLGATQLTPVSSLGFLADRDTGLVGPEQEWERWVRYVDWVTAEYPAPVLRAALAELKRRWPSNRPEGLVWGDSRLGNMMFDDAFEVVAVMDWEQPSLGGALHDLAWWLFMDRANHGARPGRPALEGMLTREETIALWQDACGKSVDEFEWYEDFVALKVAALAIQTARLLDRPMPDEVTLRGMLNGHRQWL